VGNDFFCRQLEYLRELELCDRFLFAPHPLFASLKEKPVKVKAIRYKMLRKTAPYENDTAEAEVEVEGSGEEAVQAAIAEAKRVCCSALGILDPCCADARPSPVNSDADLHKRACKLGFQLVIESYHFKLFLKDSTGYTNFGKAAKDFQHRIALVAYLEGREGK
jgi:hypothetical protein